MSQPEEIVPRVGGDEVDAECRFIADLMDDLARQDGRAHAALIRNNPDLVELYGRAGGLRQRVSAALTTTGDGVPAASRELIDRVRAALAECGASSDAAAEAQGTGPLEIGMLTSLTHRLPPEQAMELFRRITPVLVYQILERLNDSAHIPIVRRFVDHFCSAEVQARLRNCEHVREGILEEFCRVLGSSEIRRTISAGELEQLLLEGGAMHELLVMENCIKLVSSRAG